MFCCYNFLSIQLRVKCVFLFSLMSNVELIKSLYSIFKIHRTFNTISLEATVNAKIS